MIAVRLFASTKRSTWSQEFFFIHLKFKFENGIALKLWIWKLYTHEIMKIKREFPWNGEYEIETHMKSWIWKEIFHETVNMKTKTLWNDKYEITICMKAWIWNRIPRNVSHEICLIYAILLIEFVRLVVEHDGSFTQRININCRWTYDLSDIISNIKSKLNRMRNSRYRARSPFGLMCKARRWTPKGVCKVKGNI